MMRNFNLSRTWSELNIILLLQTVAAGYVDPLRSPVTGLRSYTGYNDHSLASYTYQGTLIIEQIDSAPKPSPEITSGPIPVTTAPPNDAHDSPSADSSSSSKISTFTCVDNAEREGRIRNGSTSWPYPAYSSVSCCDEIHRQWSEAAQAFTSPPSSLISTWSDIKYHTRSFTVAKCNGPFTTLCDGIPRAMCAPEVAQPALEIIPYTQLKSSLPSNWAPAPSQFPLPRPPCSVSPAQCTKLWEYLANENEVYNKEHGLFDDFGASNDSARSAPESGHGFQATNPHCSLSEKENDACLGCSFHNETVTMLYWQVDSDESLLCPKKSGSNHRLSKRDSTRITEVRTATFSGHVLTSPTPYAFYTMMRDEAGCGSAHTNMVVPIDPTEVSTFLFRPASDSTLPFASRVDFRHFAYKTVGTLSYPMVPSSAYCADNRQILMDGPCNTIYHDHRPGVVFRIKPEVLQSIDPAWRFCRNGQFMAYDPPVLLKPMESVGEAILPTPTGGANVPQPTPQGAMPSGSNFQDGIFPAVTLGPSPTLPVSIPVTLPTPREGDRFTYYASQVLPQATSSDRRGGSTDPNGVDNDPPKGSPHISPAGMNQPRDGVIFIISGQTHTAQRIPDGFSISGSIITPGGKPMAINGATVSAIQGGIVVESADIGNSESMGTSGQYAGTGMHFTTNYNPSSTTRKKNTGTTDKITVYTWRSLWILQLFYVLVLA